MRPALAPGDRVVLVRSRRAGTVTAVLATGLTAWRVRVALDGERLDVLLDPSEIERVPPPAPGGSTRLTVIEGGRP